MNRLAYLLTFTAAFGLTACGGGNNTAQPSSSSLASIVNSSTNSSIVLSSSSQLSSARNSYSVASTSVTPTYWGDVAPIIYNNCTSCHTEGGIAPFSMMTYLQTKTWAKAAASAMTDRIMPPWPQTADGSCGEYKDSKWMSDADIKTVNDWAAAGAPEGIPRTDIKTKALPTLEGGTTFKTPNFTPVITGGVLAESDEYRCFLVDPKLTADQFITGYQVTPDNKAMIHHVLVYSVDPNTMSDAPNINNAERMQQLQALDPTREGWPCFSGAGDRVVDKGTPVAWAPGQGATFFPENTGFRLKTSDKLVVQVHYNLENPATHGQSDQTEVALLLKNSVPREGFFTLWDPLLGSLDNANPDILPPGQLAYAYLWEAALNWLDQPKYDLYGSFPHMHERGKSFSAKLVHADGTSQCTADIKAWDFHWQLYYFYQKPITLSASDTLKVTCTYDTNHDTSPVLPGWGTRNEMCLYGMFIVPR